MSVHRYKLDSSYRVKSIKELRIMRNYLENVIKHVARPNMPIAPSGYFCELDGIDYIDRRLGARDIMDALISEKIYLDKLIKQRSSKFKMKKISTVFKKDENDLSRVVNKIASENVWVFSKVGEVYPTRKFDGTSCAIIDGVLYKRYDVKKGRKVPVGAIPCQEADLVTGHHPHWVACDRQKSEDKHHFDAFDKEPLSDGTYELCGPKINGNREKLTENVLIKHGSVILDDIESFDFDTLKEYLTTHDIEGIVFHDTKTMDGRMAKIRKTDFGIKR